MLLLVVLAASALTANEPAEALTYRFDEVKSKVLRSPASDVKKAARVSVGDTAAPGDLIRTGVFARAVISVPEMGARFEISSSTRARLAARDPGVLLSLEKGRLKAFFGAPVDGSATEWQIAAPVALLAVRGTRYGLEVDRTGRCLLAVFEGTVEVLPTVVGAAPIKVHADEFSTFGARMAPRSAPMKSMGLSEKSWGIAQRRQRHGTGSR